MLLTKQDLSINVFFPFSSFHDIRKPLLRLVPQPRTPKPREKKIQKENIIPRRATRGGREGQRVLRFLLTGNISKGFFVWARLRLKPERKIENAQLLHSLLVLFNSLLSKLLIPWPPTTSSFLFEFKAFYILIVNANVSVAVEVITGRASVGFLPARRHHCFSSFCPSIDDRGLSTVE